jgi:hypothetical protein
MKLHSLAALGLLAAVSGCSEKKPLPTFDFVAYGDGRHKESVHRKVVSSIVQTKPKFVLATGDLVDQGNKTELWATFRDIVKDLRSQAPFLSAAGDHDLGGEKLFEKEMGVDRLYYDRRFGDVHVFILYSGHLFSDREQVEWIEKTASASDAPHKIAVFHHPPFMIDRDRGHEAEPLRAGIHGVLVKLRFCAAFCGHQHAFYTTRRDGVRYVVTAGGGAPLWKIDPSLGQKGDLSRSFHHFVGLTIAPGGISARVFSADGREAPDLAFPLCEHR